MNFKTVDVMLEGQLVLHLPLPLQSGRPSVPSRSTKP